MSKPQQDEQHQEAEKQELAQMDAKISGHVLHSLGQPDDLRAVQVRRLWNHRYRVNVLVGLDITSVKVAHSYFLVSDLDGTILTATPAISKQY